MFRLVTGPKAYMRLLVKQAFQFPDHQREECLQRSLSRAYPTCVAVVVICLGAVVALLGSVTPALALCDMNDAVTVTENTKLNWGTLQIPTSGSETCVSSTSSAACAAGSTGSVLYGSSARGEYTLTKDNNFGPGVCTITIDVVNLNTGSPHLTLGSITGAYDGVPLSGPPPWSGLAKPSSPTPLILGMTATYTSSIPASTLAPSFGIKVTVSPNATTPQTSSMTASASFDSPLTIDNVVNINFGNVQGNNGNVYTINTAGAVTPSGGGVVYSGSKNAGSMLIHGSSTQTIQIFTGFYASSSAGGASAVPSAATCAYNGGAATSCDFPGLTFQAGPGSGGKTLLLGVKVTVSGNSTGGTATPSFTVLVNYV